MYACMYTLNIQYIFYSQFTFRLYFTNMGMVAVDGVSFAWHKVEAIGVDGEGRRTILDQATKPRGLYTDQSAGG